MELENEEVCLLTLINKMKASKIKKAVKTMKKLVTILAMVFTIAMLAGCDSFSTSQPSTSEQGSEIVTPNDSENEKDGDEVVDDDSSKVVQPITGGGSFNAGNSYNK